MRAGRDETVREIDVAWQGLKQALARVPRERIGEGGVVEMWPVKDVVGHIAIWENEAIDSLRRYLSRDDVKMLAWPDVDALNERTVSGKRRKSRNAFASTPSHTTPNTPTIFAGGLAKGRPFED